MSLKEEELKKLEKNSIAQQFAATIAYLLDEWGHVKIPPEKKEKLVEIMITNITDLSIDHKNEMIKDLQEFKELLLKRGTI